MLIEVSNKEKLNKYVKGYKNKGYVEEKDKLIYRLLKKVNITPDIKINENHTKLVKESIVKKILVFIPTVFLLFLISVGMAAIILFFSAIIFFILVGYSFYAIMKSDKFNKDVVEITTNKLNLNVNIGGKARVERVANKKELDFMTEQYNTAGYKTEIIGVDYTRLSKKKFKWWLFIILFFFLFIGAIIYSIYYAIKEKEIVIIKIDENNPKSKIEDTSTNINNNEIESNSDSIREDNTENKSINNNEANSTITNSDNIKYCTECGNPVSDDNKFCKNCGKPVK